MQSSLTSFLLVSVVLGGGGAWMTGRALAQGWKPLWQALAYMLPLALAVRFFHYALAHEKLVAPVDLAIDLAVLGAITALSHRVATTALLVRQYPWIYRRTSPVSVARTGGA